MNSGWFWLEYVWILLGNCRDPTGKVQGTLGSFGKLWDAPGRSRTALGGFREAPGGPREALGGIREAVREAPGQPREAPERLREALGRFWDAPGGSRGGQEGAGGSQARFYLVFPKENKVFMV